MMNPPDLERVPRLSIRSVSKVYGSGADAVTVIAELDFDVQEREIVCIVGPSGIGKTTLLKCLAGLQSCTTGKIAIDGKVIDGPPAEMALVFQEYTRSLMPWLSVRNNVRLPLRHLRLPAKEERSRIADAIDAVGLSSSSEKYPWQLSGGMQQRVSIARAIAYRPEVLVMDEPFASVDAQTRAELEDLVLRVREQFGVTVILVTHDIDEAVYMSDRVVVLSRPPSTVQELVTVNLPRPRDQVETKALPEFAALRAQIYETIMQPRAVQLA